MDLRGPSNWDFSIPNHRNEEEEVRKRSYVEGSPYQNGGVLRVLLGAVGICMMGFLPSSRQNGPVFLTSALLPAHLLYHDVLISGEQHSPSRTLLCADL